MLASLETIPRQDFQAEGTVTETDWPEADYIIGNPPFLGNKRLRAELEDEYFVTLTKTFEGTIPGGSDLVCYFFEKARAHIERGAG